MMANSADYLLKIILIGDSGSGKSSYLIRLINDSFSRTLITTIGIDYKVKSFQIQDYQIKLQLWDTGGQERFRTITRSYLRSVHAVMIFFDLSCRKQFDNIRSWYNDAILFASSNVKIILIGAKCDHEHAISLSEIQALAKELQVPYYETSSLINKNIEESCLDLTVTTFQSILFRENDHENSKLRLIKGSSSLFRKNIHRFIRDMVIAQPTILIATDRDLVITWKGKNFDANETACLYHIESSVGNSCEWKNLTRVSEPKCTIAVDSSNMSSYRIRATLQDRHGPISHEWSGWSPILLYPQNPSAPVTAPSSTLSLPPVIDRAPSLEESNNARSEVFESLLLFLTSFFNSEWRPKWTNDSTCFQCERCDADFSPLFRRKHHCRQCGKCLCSVCLPGDLRLLVESYDHEVKVCSVCYYIDQRNIWIKSTCFLPPVPEYAVSGAISMKNIPGLIIESDSSFSIWKEGKSSVVFRGKYNNIPVALKLYKGLYLELRKQAMNHRYGYYENQTENDLFIESKIYSSNLIKSCPHAISLIVTNIEGNDGNSMAQYPFIGTELIDKYGTLGEILVKSEYKLTWKWKLAALWQISSFLTYLHSLKYIHGDLTSSNCIIRSFDSETRDVVRVFDFSSSCQFGKRSIKELEVLFHTPTHTPPEILTAILEESFKPYFELNGTVDIYYFGILMCEVLMKELSYVEVEQVSTRGGLEQLTMNGQRPILRESKGEGVPNGYLALVEECWHQDPNRRPSAHDIVKRIEQMLDQENQSNVQASMPDDLLESSTGMKINQNDQTTDSLVSSSLIPSSSISPTSIFGNPVNITVPLHIIILNRSDFIKTNFFQKSLAKKLEKGILGLKAFCVEDETLNDYHFNSPGGHFEVGVLYRRHPNLETRKYIPIKDFTEEMLKEKEEEFLSIVRNLGAKTVQISSCERKFDATDASLGVSAGEVVNLNIGAGVGNVEGWIRERSCQYENPAGSSPIFDEKRKYIFYHHEPEWKGIKESRLSSSPLISTRVSFRISSQDYQIGVIEAKLIEIGGISMKYNHSEQRQIYKTYAIDFFTCSEYIKYNRLIVSKWGSLDVLHFLDKIQLSQYKKMFGEYGITGEDLLSSELNIILSQMNVLEEHIGKISRKIREEIDSRCLENQNQRK